MFAGRRKRIESESRSGILYERQEKAMEKTITKLCLMLAMLYLVRMADAVTIAVSYTHLTLPTKLEV